jgi:hypothetical protein
MPDTLLAGEEVKLTILGWRHGGLSDMKITT